jgi:AcrR family transcriptional regulator
LRVIVRGVSKPDSTRPYRMQTRAKAKAETGMRILEAAEEIFDAGSTDQFTLVAIADRAGVSVQTVIRHFESREGLLTATLLHAGGKMREFREAVPVDDPRRAVASLVSYFDRYGDRILRLIAERERNPTIRAMTDFGWTQHREWCETAFAGTLDGLSGVSRERRLAQLSMITGIHVWKILRSHNQLSQPQTELAIREMLEPLIGPDA